jgi:folate-binding protein YgfZ
MTSTDPAITGFFELPPRALLLVTGADRLRYLNGQLSIDIRRLADKTSRTACLLTAKGKLCAHVRIWSHSDGHIVETLPDLVEAVQARLERYIIADDVTISPLPESRPLYHVIGCPPPDDSIQSTRVGCPGFDTFEKPINLLALTPDSVDRLRIIHGVPAWNSEMNEDTLPQEARLETTSVDFDKGCYVGQEVVSRLKSVGRVNKRLHGFIGQFETPAQTRLQLHPVGKPETIAGHITSTALHFDMAQTLALGYLNRQSEELTRFEVRDENGCLLGEVDRREFPIL